MKFDPNKMSLCTILFEGPKHEVENQQKIVYAIAKNIKDSEQELKMVKEVISSPL